MKEDLGDLVSHRLARAREALEEAQILAGAGRWSACVNRLYYACFYAVSALLVKDGLTSPKHTGTRSLFNKHYVKTGKVPKSMARIYNDLFERRQEGDYMDFVSFNATQISAWMDLAQQFIEHIMTLALNGSP